MSIAAWKALNPSERERIGTVNRGIGAPIS
jgi:hypothetical protein